MSELDRPTVLLVGQGERMQRALAQALERHQLLVEEAASDSVVDAAFAAAPDVLVLLGDAAADGGEEALTRLSQHVAASMVPVVLLSDEAGLGQRLDAFRHGVVAVVPKSASADGMARRIADIARELPDRPGEVDGDLGEATVDELVDLFSQQLRSGILSVSAGDDSGASAQVVLRAGRPVTEAIQELVRQLRPLVQARPGPLRYEFHESPDSRLGLFEDEGDEEELDDTLPGRRVLVIEQNPARADVLVQELRARGALVVVADGEGAGLERARGQDPDVVVIDVSGVDGWALPALRGLRRDPRLRWASLLVVDTAELWPSPERGPDMERLAAAIAPLLRADRDLAQRALDEETFDTRLEQLGPARMLRALTDTGLGLALSVWHPRVRVQVDLAEGLVVGAQATSPATGRPIAQGPSALAALMGLGSGRVRIERKEAPSATNVMAPVDDALAAAAAEEPPVAPSLPPPPSLSEQPPETVVPRGAGVPQPSAAASKPSKAEGDAERLIGKLEQLLGRLQDVLPAAEAIARRGPPGPMRPPPRKVQGPPSGQMPRPSGQKPRPSGQKPRPSGQKPRPSGQMPRPSGSMAGVGGKTGPRRPSATSPKAGLPRKPAAPPKGGMPPRREPPDEPRSFYIDRTTPAPSAPPASKQVAESIPDYWDDDFDDGDDIPTIEATAEPGVSPEPETLATPSPEAKPSAAKPATTAAKPAPTKPAPTKPAPTKPAPTKPASTKPARAAGAGPAVQGARRTKPAKKTQLGYEPQPAPRLDALPEPAPERPVAQALEPASAAPTARLELQLDSEPPPRWQSQSPPPQALPAASPRRARPVPAVARAVPPSPSPDEDGPPARGGGFRRFVTWSLGLLLAGVSGVAGYFYYVHYERTGDPDPQRFLVRMMAMTASDAGAPVAYEPDAGPADDAGADALALALLDAGAGDAAPMDAGPTPDGAVDAGDAGQDAGRDGGRDAGRDGGRDASADEATDQADDEAELSGEDEEAPPSEGRGERIRHHLRSANFQRNRGNMAEAEAAYMQALRYDPNNPRALAGMTRVAMATRRADAAVRWARQLVHTRSGNPNNHILLGDAHAAAGNAAAARQEWTRALELDPDSRTARRRLAQ